MVCFSTDNFHVLWIRAHIFCRDVTPAKEFDEPSMRTKDTFAIDRILAKDNRLAPAEWSAGERILVSHAARQPQQIRDRGLVVGVSPESGATNRRSELTAVDRDEAAIISVDARRDFFVFCDFQLSYFQVAADSLRLFTPYATSLQPIPSKFSRTRSPSCPSDPFSD